MEMTLRLGEVLLPSVNIGGQGRFTVAKISTMTRTKSFPEQTLNRSDLYNERIVFWSNGLRRLSGGRSCL